MKIFLFILVPVLVVTAYALYQWARTRQPSSVESGIDAFRREMSALSPDRAPVNRRPERLEPIEAVEPLPMDQPTRPTAPPAPPRPGPRRPGSAEDDR